MSDADVARLSDAKRKVFQGEAKALPLLARLSTTDTKQEQTIKLEVKNNTTGIELKQAIHAFLLTGAADKGKLETSVNMWTPEGLPPSQQRLFFMGREVGNEEHMQGAQVSSGCVVQVFIAQGARAGGVGAAAAGGGGGGRGGDR